MRASLVPRREVGVSFFSFTNMWNAMAIAVKMMAGWVVFMVFMVFMVIGMIRAMFVVRAARGRVRFWFRDFRMVSVRAKWAMMIRAGSQRVIDGGSRRL